LLSFLFLDDIKIEFIQVPLLLTVNDKNRLVESLLELELVLDQGLVHKVAHAGGLVPTNRIVVHVDLTQTTHHLQLVL
jgi:hypothetical protein